MCYRVKPWSMYGSAGGYSTRVSSSIPYFGSSCQFYNENCFLSREKALMQNLNDRLAVYMGNLDSLERKNTKLEKKIVEWCASHSVESHDNSEHLTTIKSLEDQIHQVYVSMAATKRNFENTRLAAEDFRAKYEVELAFRKGVERDTVCVRKEIDELTLCRSNLEMEYESLREERINLEKTYEEEKAEIRAQSLDQLDVCVDAAPSTELRQTLTRIREEYEAVAERNKRDLEAWVQMKFSTLKKLCTEQSEDLEANNVKIKQLKTKIQNMELELHSESSMLLSRKDTLQNSITMYAAKEAQLQEVITDLDLMVQDMEAKKIHGEKRCGNLQAEIKEYKSLLEMKDRDFQVSQKILTVLNVMESSQTVTKY